MRINNMEYKDCKDFIHCYTGLWSALGVTYKEYADHVKVFDKDNHIHTFYIKEITNV
tara:strand:- start:379 stop:549 length:171 start_codon:yes stop_codon:yes gene_type:complete